MSAFARAGMAALGLALSAAWPAAAADGLSRIYGAPVERVFEVVARALEAEGWEVDDADRALAQITTRSQGIAGEFGGLWAKTRRTRLRVQLSPAGAGETRVTVTREDFLRERVLWMVRDEPVPRRDPLVRYDRTLEERVLAAIGRAI